MTKEALQETKRCSNCNKVKPLSEFYKGEAYKDGYRGQCKECMYNYYIENRLKTGKQKIMFNKCYSEKADKYNSTNKELKRRKRLMVLKHYSDDPPKCACCGETIIDFLTIDHINEDGAKHRNKGIRRIANWLIKNNYPEGFQVLCWNCNWGRRVNNGVCPHKTSSKIEDAEK